MGLDGVELVIAVEDQFGITIRDAEAQSVRTVGDLLELINSRLAARGTAHCPSVGAFLSVRRLVRDFLSQPALRLRPSTRITSIVPARRRSDLWAILSDLFGSPARALRRPRPMRIALIAISCVAMGLGFATAVVDPKILPLGIFMAFAVMLCLHIVTTPFRIEPPVGLETLGDITRSIAGLSMATTPVSSACDVLPRVQAIVSEILGVDKDEVVPETRFVEDLDMA